MTITRRIFLSTIAGGIAAPAIIGRAQASTTLVVASLLGPDKPETLVWNRVRDLVEKELPGEFTFNVVPNAALGGEKEVTEGLRLGSIQASLFTLSNLSGWVPECQMFDLPFLFRDEAHQLAALAGEHGDALRNQLAEQRLIAPAFIYYGARHLLAKEPLTSPHQMRERRIRVIQSPLHAQLWEAFGSLPIALPITETYNALATGHIAAMDLTKSAYAGFRLYEVVPQVTETGHIHAAGAVVFSQSFWSSLTSRQAEVLQAASIQGARHFNELMRADEEASVKLAMEQGAQFHAIEDRAAWEGPARAVWESFADKVGGMERIQAIADLGCA